MLPDSIRVFERGWLSSNNILCLDSGEGATLVDTGYVTHAEQTVALLEHALGGRHLDRIVNTHCHSDHIGGNAAIVRRFDSRVIIPHGEADNVLRWDEDALHLASFGQRAERFSFDATFRPGDRLTMGGFEWQALAAPGHDTDALVYHAPEPRILLSGDALWENGFGVLFPELFGEPGIEAARATLDMIAALGVRTVIPGHGRVFHDVGAALGRAHARLDAFAQDPGRIVRNAFRVLAVFHVLERESATVADLARLIERAAFFGALNARAYRLPPAALAETLAGELVASGALAFDGERLRAR